MIYTENFKITASMTDMGEGVSILGIAQIIQDNVSAFFSRYGKDNVSLKRDYNSVWVIVKNRFKKLDVAYWNERVTAKSFITKRTSATVIIDTEIIKEDGTVAVVARTEMCVISLDTQRIVRIEKVGLSEEIGVYPTNADFEFSRFEFSDLKDIYSFTVPSTSIDFCNHFNNVEYLRFILNTVPVNYGLTHVVKDLEIHYVNQSREGDSLNILSKREGVEDYYEVINGDKVAVRCKTVRT